jgi:hypothetical protein
VSAAGVETVGRPGFASGTVDVPDCAAPDWRKTYSIKNSQIGADFNRPPLLQPARIHFQIIALVPGQQQKLCRTASRDHRAGDSAIESGAKNEAAPGQGRL